MNRLESTVVIHGRDFEILRHCFPRRLVERLTRICAVCLQRWGSKGLKNSESGPCNSAQNTPKDPPKQVNPGNRYHRRLARAWPNPSLNRSSNGRPPVVSHFESHFTAPSAPHWLTGKRAATVSQCGASAALGVSDFLTSWWSKAVGMWAKARAVVNASALSTGRAGARQRIVHMSTAWMLLGSSAPRCLCRLDQA